MVAIAMQHVEMRPRTALSTIPVWCGGGVVLTTRPDSQRREDGLHKSRDSMAALLRARDSEVELLRGQARS